MAETMDILDDQAADQQARIEKRANQRTTVLLTGGLTHQADAFLVGCGAVALMIALFPLIGALSLLVFPAVFAVTVIVRAVLRRGPQGGRPV